MGKGGMGDGQVVESRDILERRGDKEGSLRDMMHTHSLSHTQAKRRSKMPDDVLLHNRII